MPPASDTRTKRPVVVFIHGGGFTDGTREWSQIPAFLIQLATRGLAVVTIDYRLEGALNDWVNEPMIYDAVEDARAAVRYVRSVADDQKLDTDRIMVMGESAGALTSLFYAYAKDAQGEGKSGNPGFSSAIRAAGAISGEMKS
jgi:acetyl esterase/lipase